MRLKGIRVGGSVRLGPYWVRGPRTLKSLLYFFIHLHSAKLFSKPLAPTLDIKYSIISYGPNPDPLKGLGVGGRSLGDFDLVRSDR
jgi:hypothetical protein